MSKEYLLIDLAISVGFKKVGFYRLQEIGYNAID